MLSPGLHYWLGYLTLVAPLMGHPFVVGPLIYRLELRVLTGIQQLWGIEAAGIDTEVLMAARVCVHTAAIVLEFVFAATVYWWVGRKLGIRCPACGSPMKRIDKWFQPVTTYACTHCHFRKHFKLPDHGGG